MQLDALPRRSLFVLSLAVPVAISGCGNYEPANVPVGDGVQQDSSPAASAPAPVAAGRVENSAHGVSIVPPKGWEPLPDRGNFYLRYKEPAAGAMELVVFDAPDKGLTVDQWIEAYKQGLAQKGVQFPGGGGESRSGEELK